MMEQMASIHCMWLMFGAFFVGLVVGGICAVIGFMTGAGGVFRKEDT